MDSDQNDSDLSDWEEQQSSPKLQRTANPPPADAADAETEDDEDEVAKEDAEFQAHLARVRHEDQPLQMLLRSVGAKWCLKPHQFTAVRSVAGVPVDWPATFDEHGKPDSLPGLPVDRGICLGDDMGLGKTIESLAGFAIRDFLNLQSDSASARRPALVVTPNAAVAAQWCKEALGMLSESEIWSHDASGPFAKALERRFSSAATDPASLPRMVIVTRRQLQDEMSHVFKSHREAGGWKPSLLAPHLTQQTAVAMEHKWLARSKITKDKAYVKEQHFEGERWGQSAHAPAIICHPSFSPAPCTPSLWLSPGDESTPSGGVLELWRKEQKAQFATVEKQLFSMVLLDEVHDLKCASLRSQTSASSGPLTQSKPQQSHASHPPFAPRANRNLHSMATMLAEAISLHSPRVVAISGTGYNNHLQDMATLHMLIDPV